MFVESAPQLKYTFSGHEKFQCRHLWLKKGYDYLQLGKSFLEEDSVIELGVGKNMVASIRFWLKAFGITDNQDQITQVGELLFSKDGFDEYLEDDASLWLLHYLLVKTNFASTYSLIFNEFRKERNEFSTENFEAFIKRKSDAIPSLSFNPNTIQNDFDIFRKMYVSSEEDYKNIDDSFLGLLTDLHLVGTIQKEEESIVADKTKKRTKQVLFLENTDRESLPVEIFLFSILDNTGYGSSISLPALENDFNSPGNIFALSKTGLVTKIQEAQEKYPNDIIYTDHAGIKELQFKRKIDPIEMLTSYYEK
ncbi:DUF4007 family protein [uncultured Pontibacter sp.]|uniref:DUF4007 family protein n=1 Tax=uncultured Pontibacter sp. TaxID=453356 RepID=UPI00262FC539|nr:DUF4007 family protein [uncultured Pontibacter sp.]